MEIIKRFFVLFIFILFTGIFPIGANAQGSLPRIFPELMESTNSTFKMPDGWNMIHNSWYLADSNRIFYNRFTPYFTLYNKRKDMYIFFCGQYIRSGYRRQSDVAANNYYLSSKYLKLDHKIPADENLISQEQLRSAGVDTVVAFQLPLDTPVFGKYHYAKQFVLHKQDIANWELTFVVRSKEKERAIDQTFKDIWGVICFKADSAFHPTTHTSSLVGKFRHLRPKLNTQDSIANAAYRKKMNFVILMTDGKASEKKEDLSAAKNNYLQAHALLPSSPAPYQKIFMMYLEQKKLDSASVYWEKLRDEYLPGRPDLIEKQKFGLVILYEKKGMYDSAIRVCKQIIEKSPDNLHGYSALATMYKKKADFHKALIVWKKAENRTSKKREKSYFNFQIGVCYKNLSNTAMAQKYFVKAKKEGYPIPDNIKVEFNL